MAILVFFIACAFVVGLDIRGSGGLWWNGDVFREFAGGCDFFNFIFKSIALKWIPY